MYVFVAAGVLSEIHGVLDDLWLDKPEGLDRVPDGLWSDN